MTIPYDLTADLPPPRDDEPASLRQDIVDELADHLECALRRELLRRGTSSLCETASDSADSSFRTDPRTDSSFRTAQQTVLARFGDPAALARRLWLDAMKERLMAQKITILLASVATAAVVVLSVLMWQSLQRSHEAQAALLQQQQQFSASILETLKALRAAPAAPASVDGWSPLTVKLVSETGEPVQGEANLTGTQFGGDKQDINLRRTTGPNGVMDFGMLPYGNYQLDVTATAGRERHAEPLTITPGMSGERTIVCPTSPLPEVEMRFAFNPPATLQTEDLRYRVNISARSRRVGDGEWVSTESNNAYLWVDASGDILKLVREEGEVPYGPNDRSRCTVGVLLDSVPPLREYIYELEGVSMFVANLAVDAVEPGYRDPNVDEWAIRARAQYAPRYNKVSFAPRADAENIWKIDIPEDIWAAVIDDFRDLPLARHVTIPDGFEMVTLSVGPRWGKPVIRQSDYVDVIANVVSSHDDPAGEPLGTLIDAAQFIATDHRQSGMGTVKVHVVLLVTPEQKGAIEEVKSFDFVRLDISPAEKVSEIPVLHEDVLEQLKKRAEVNEPIDPPGERGT